MLFCSQRLKDAKILEFKIAEFINLIFFGTQIDKISEIVIILYELLTANKLIFKILIQLIWLDFSFNFRTRIKQI